MLLSKVASSVGARAASSYIALYSTVSGLAAVRTWRVSSPAPVSLVGDDVPAETQQRPARQVTSNNGKKPLSLAPTPVLNRVHRQKLKEQFPEGWSPPKKLSRQAMDGIRVMHAQHPEVFTTPVLAEKFRVSPEAVRRILKSKWEPTQKERARMLQREQRLRQEHIQNRRLKEMRDQLEVARERSVARRQREDTESQLSLR